MTTFAYRNISFNPLSPTASRSSRTDMIQVHAIEKIEKVTELLEEIYDLLDEVHYDYVLPCLEIKDGETNNQLRNHVINSLGVAKLDVDQMKVFLETIPLDMVEG